MAGQSQKKTWQRLIPQTEKMDQAMEARTKLYYGPSSDQSNTNNAQEYLIFLIPGNPGLIPFYDPFLSALHALLESSPALRSSNFHLCGHSLRGFEATQGDVPHLAGLQDQIKYVDDLLYERVDGIRDTTGHTPKVILMGHSVGAYILLEIIRRHRTRIESLLAQDFDLIGGILLFPTITHIARSPSGIVASTLLSIPGSAHIASAMATALMYLIPSSFLYWLIRFIMRFPDHAARTTAAFIKSPIGIKESLFLGKDEMDQITDDRWGKEIWGAATEPGTNSKDTISSNLVFFWGRHDAWVAKRTRNDLINARGYRDSPSLKKRPSSGLTDSPVEGWKPSMFIDDGRIPHGFCIKHSEVVARKVQGWVEDIIYNHDAI
ncbi:MAG: hypothetical protein LQ343_007156 [Gyalolechia ehrenbergii]|nr:MAG: hypothetical protein LQ343_007156 [Gyalolechia ehrenbergii]